MANKNLVSCSAFRVAVNQIPFPIRILPHPPSSCISMHLLPLNFLFSTASRLPRPVLRRFSMTATTPTIATHDGTFHCDEVLACHMLRNHTAQFSKSPILRTRDPALLDTAHIVVDVGAVYNPQKMRFDHHQRGFETTFASAGKRTRTKLSSAGLVYKHYGPDIIRSVAEKAQLKIDDHQIDLLYLKVYDAFVEAIDAVDNGINMYHSEQPPRYEASTDLSSRVGRFNAEWYEQNPDQDANFHKAMTMAGHEFDDCIVRIIKSWLPARSIIESALKKRFDVDPSGAILVITEWAPWKDHLFAVEEEERQNGVEKPVSYVVYKDMTGSSWRIQCVPVAKGSFQSRYPLPEIWRGIRDDALSELTGIPNCIFVHAAGFIGGNKDFDGAMNMAKAAKEMTH